jgi:hypothetical protein
LYTLCVIIDNDRESLQFKKAIGLLKNVENHHWHRIWFRKGIKWNMKGKYREMYNKSKAKHT